MTAVVFICGLGMLVFAYVRLNAFTLDQLLDMSPELARANDMIILLAVMLGLVIMTFAIAMGATASRDQEIKRLRKKLQDKEG